MWVPNAISYAYEFLHAYLVYKNVLFIYLLFLCSFKKYLFWAIKVCWNLLVQIMLLSREQASQIMFSYIQHQKAHFKLWHAAFFSGFHHWILNSLSFNPICNLTYTLHKLYYQLPVGSPLVITMLGWPHETIDKVFFTPVVKFQLYWNFKNKDIQPSPLRHGIPLRKHLG